MGMGMGLPFNSAGLGTTDAPRSWDVHGYYKPSDLQQMAGMQLQVVVTQYGRVGDGCNAAAMGPAITSSTNPLMTGGLGMMNPYLSLQNGIFGNSLQSRPAGHLDTPMVVMPGGLNMYSSTLNGVSRAQLQGAGVAICPSVGANGLCVGPIIMCCTLAKDMQMATQSATPGPIQGGFGGFAGGAGLAAFQGLVRRSGRNEELWERAGQEPVAKQILRRKWGWIWTHPQEAGIQHHTPSPDMEPAGEKEERPASQQLEAGH
nr:hypothetical protein BaRGS_007790 [Batillaria attramentaria]